MIDFFDQFSRIYWREPFWLFIGLQPILVYLLRQTTQQRQYLQFADRKLLPWVIIHSNKTKMHNILEKIFSKDSAYILAWFLFAIATAGPRLALEIPDQKLENNTDIMLVVDVSRSMQANDVSPNRIRRAQIEISELLERSHGNRIGIVVFAARPHLYVPLTSDYTALRFYLKSLDDLILPTMGSQPASALNLAYQELKPSNENLDKTQNPKSAIILITDGDWHEPSNIGTQQLKDTSMALSLANISVNILGVATKEGGAIPLTQDFDKTGWLKHKGQSIVSRMDETKLQQLAEDTGGRYSPVYNNDRDWVALYDKSILNKNTSSLNNIPEDRVIWHELYPWVLAPAILFLWIAIIPYGLQSWLLSFLRRDAFSTFLIFTVSIMLTLIPQRPVNADELERQAYKAYADSDYRAALSIYKKSNGYIARMGEASSLYQLRDYKGAIQQFTQAILDAKGNTNRASGLYNLGNSYFKLGDYRSAVRVYQDALIYQPNHNASRHNLAFSETLLKAIDKRLLPSAGKNTTGAGPIQSDVDNGLVVNEYSSISVDDSQEQLPQALSLPEIRDVSNNTMQRLLNKGLRYIKLADEGSENKTYSGKRLEALAQSNALIRMTELEDRQALLWKRMFEIEEGFSAPQDKPSEVQGVSPW